MSIASFCQALRGNDIHRRAQATDGSNADEPVPDHTDRKSKVIVPLPHQVTVNSSKIIIDSKNHLTGDRRLKAIILHKAAVAYYCLVDQCEKERKYGSCLRYLRLSLDCYSKIAVRTAHRSLHPSPSLGAELKLQSMDKNNASTECKKLLSYIMSVAGDCRLMMSHASSTEDIERFRDELQAVDSIDLEIQKVIDGIGIEETSAGEHLFSVSFIRTATMLFDRRIQLDFGAHTRDRTESIGERARL